jgi:hypothetical protein
VHCNAVKCRDHCDHSDSKSPWPHPHAPHCRRARTRHRLAVSRTVSLAALVSQVQRADTLFIASAGADGLLDVSHKGGRAQAHLQVAGTEDQTSGTLRWIEFRPAECTCPPLNVARAWTFVDSSPFNPWSISCH